MKIDIEEKSGCKVYDLSLGNRGEVRVWSFGQHEKWFFLSCGYEHTLKYVQIGNTFYRYVAHNEGKAIQKFLAERRKMYEESIKKLYDYNITAYVREDDEEDDEEEDED